MRWRVGFALLAAAFGSGPAGADPLQDIQQCSQISNNDLRLICYDTAARGIGSLTPAAPPAPPVPQAGATEAAPPAAATVAPAPEPQVAASAPPAPKKKTKGWFGLFGGGKDKDAADAVAAQPAAPPPSQVEAFGANRLPRTETESAGKPKEISSIRSTITDYAYTPFDRIIVFLENGQVWRQLDGDAKKLRLRKGQTYVAEVKKAALGSFNLAIDGVDGFVKVTRIK